MYKIDQLKKKINVDLNLKYKKPKSKSKDQSLIKSPIPINNRLPSSKLSNFGKIK